MKKLITICAVLLIVIAANVNANTIASSTMYFETAGGYTLTYNSGSETYNGVIPMKVDCGYDIYAKNGATAGFKDGSNITITDHDGWPTWTPDTADWYQYSLNLYVESGVQKWAVRNHPGANSTSDPWYDNSDGDTQQACGVPMSGTMDWINMYASETDIGAYLPSTGTGKYPGWAADNGGGVACWDMDWSWDSEVVPLEYPGFDVDISYADGIYTVIMTPAIPEPTTICLLGLGALSLIRRKK